MTAAERLRQWWDWATVGPVAVAEASYEPRPPDLPPGRPNISSGAGPEVRNLPFAPVTLWLALRQPPIWRGINLIAGTVSSLPLHSFRHLERIEPTPQLLRDPSPTMTRSEIWRALMVDFLVYGNAIAHLSEWDEWAWPHRMRPLPAEGVEARVVDGEIVEYRYNETTLSPAEILHLRWLTVPGYAFGIGLLEAHSDGLVLMERLRRHARGHFDGEAVPSGLLKVHRAEVTKEQAERLKGDWMEAHSGARTPGVLPEEVDWISVAVNPEQSQLLQSRQYSAAEAEFMLNLPPGMLGGSGVGGGRMTYQNVESLDRLFHDQTLLPILATAEQRLTRSLPGLQYAKFAVDGLLRGDSLTRHRIYEIELNTGIRTIDEIRALEDLPPRPGQTIEPASSPGGGRLSE
jgi:HK97 family phage portal protein